MNSFTPSQKLQGGLFGLEFGGPGSIPCRWLQVPHVAVANARGGLALLVRHLVPGCVWLPSFLCGDIVHALPTEQARRFYPVNALLRCADSNWLDEVRTGDLVLFVDYFGRVDWEPMGTAARERGAWILEDGAQALLQPGQSPVAHFGIWSPRKFVGVTDGGFLTVAPGVPLPAGPLDPINQVWWFKALQAAAGRAEFDLHGGRREWFHCFRDAEAAHPSNPTMMSELTRSQLATGFAWEAMADRRRRNFRHLAAGLPAWAVFADFPETSAPLGFPVRHPRRDQVRARLFAHDIFPPVHWAIADIVPSEFGESHTLAREIMTLPCDHRLDSADMDRLVAAFRGAA